MTLLTRDAILGAQDLKIEDVEVPEWGGTVRVRMMTGAQRDALGASMVTAGGKPDMHKYRIGLVAACIVGDDGVPMFAADEVALLAGKSSVALDRVYRVAERLNDSSAVGVEAAEKN
jgi:hypothetical protein